MLMHSISHRKMSMVPYLVLCVCVCVCVEGGGGGRGWKGVCGSMQMCSGDTISSVVCVCVCVEVCKCVLELQYLV